MIGTSVVDVAATIEAEIERLKEKRPALLSRIERAETIIVTHLSCPGAGIVRPRIRGGELVAYLVKGTGGTVYRVEPDTFSCSCPDYHRRGKGCKHSIACYALGRAFRPGPTTYRAGRRCDAEKVTRHDAHANGFVAKETTDNEARAAVSPIEDTYGETTCSRCFDGLTYDGQRGEWVVCERCEGTGRVMAFLYEHASRRLSECVGCGERYPHRELIEVTEDHESLTWFVGDKLCRQGCASAHGVL